MAGRPKKIQPEPIEEIVQSINENKSGGYQVTDNTITFDEKPNVDVDLLKLDTTIFYNQQVEENKTDNNDITLVSEKVELSVFDNQPKDTITQKYLEKVNESSDINELLHFIYGKASECSHCTEFGVRIPTSTYALLAARPARVVSYDIGRYPQVDEVEQLCKEVGQDFEFRLENVLTADIEETDLLFIDDFHSEKMLAADLRLHAHKVRKYIIGHDYETYGLIGEQPYNDETSPYGGGRGIKFAVDAFLENNDEWKMEFSTPINNGLFILKRIGTKGRD